VVRFQLFAQVTAGQQFLISVKSEQFPIIRTFGLSILLVDLFDGKWLLGGLDLFVGVGVLVALFDRSGRDEDVLGGVDETLFFDVDEVGVEVVEPVGGAEFDGISGQMVVFSFDVEKAFADS